MMKSYILFDFDGTLVDSAPAILDCFEQVLRVHGMQPCRTIDASLIGPPLRQTLEALSGCNDPRMLDALSASFKEVYDTEACLRTSAYEGCHDLLEQLRVRGLTLAIATNKRLVPTQRIIQALGWQEMFALVYASDSQPRRYADKAGMIAALLHDGRIAPHSAVYVGDTDSDGKAAAANDVEFWPVAWGYGTFAPTDRPVETSLQLLDRLASPSVED